MFKPCDTTFNIDRHLIPFLQEVPFFAELSRQIKKVPTTDMPTAAIAFDYKADEVSMYYNPEFFSSLGNWQLRGVITHEFYHFIFGHIHSRRKKPPRLWNVAADLAINSIIESNAKQHPPQHVETGDTPLPLVALIPGKFPFHPEGREFSAEEKEGVKLGQIISKLPPMQASEWYFNKLWEEAKKEQEKNGGGEGDGLENLFGDGDEIIKSLDDHDPWDDIPEDHREFIEGRVKAMIEKAVKYADSHPQGWGHMPSDIREEIRKSVSNIINWRGVLRQFIGSILRGDRTTSIKRINRRYPYVHPGVKRGYVAKLLIAIDQSGSVDDNMLEMFFSELRTLSKRVSIDILPFDADAREGDIFTWRRGTIPDLKRIRCGGTNFDAPSDLFNDAKNRGRWNGLLIMTDGECGKPASSRGKRGWIIGKGQRLLFETDELIVKLDDAKSLSGAWR
jgi:predicted metal-dependent peptidase